MNVRFDRWQGLLGADADLHDPQTNIRAGIELLRRIMARLPQPEIDQIATVYNNLSADFVTDCGARVAEVYRDKPWLQSLQLPTVP